MAKYKFSSGTTKVTVEANSLQQAKSLAAAEMNRRARKANISAPAKWDLQLVSVINSATGEPQYP